MFWTSDPINCPILSFNTVLGSLDNSTSFTSSCMKDLCQKRKVKLILRGTYRLSGTGIVECLEIVDVGCNLKQFDGLTWLTLTSITDSITPYFTTGLRHWAIECDTSLVHSEGSISWKWTTVTYVGPFLCGDTNELERIQECWHWSVKQAHPTNLWAPHCEK